MDSLTHRVAERAIQQARLSRPRICFAEDSAEEYCQEYALQAFSRFLDSFESSEAEVKKFIKDQLRISQEITPLLQTLMVLEAPDITRLAKTMETVLRGWASLETEFIEIHRSAKSLQDVVKGEYLKWIREVITHRDRDPKEAPVPQFPKSEIATLLKRMNAFVKKITKISEVAVLPDFDEWFGLRSHVVDKIKRLAERQPNIEDLTMILDDLIGYCEGIPSELEESVEETIKNLKGRPKEEW